MAAARRGLGSPFGTVGLLVIFALLGAAAALLAGRAPTVNATTSTAVNFSIPNSVWAILFLAPLLVGVLAFVVRWVISSDAGVPARIGTIGAVVLVIGVLLFALVTHANWTATSTVTLGGYGSGSAANGATPGGHNGSHFGNGTQGNVTNGTNGTTSGNGTTGTNGTLTKGGWNSTTGNVTGSGGHNGGSGSGSGRGDGLTNNSTAPLGTSSSGGVSMAVANWLFLLVAVVLSAMVGVLAIPGVLGRLVDPRASRPVPQVGLADPAAFRAALNEAKVALESGESPREAIVRLYSRLLGRVEPSPNGLTSSTAEEIQRTRLAELRVPPVHSETLTRIFEEACYSKHPIGRGDAERFVAALWEIEHDLFPAGVGG